MTLTPMTSLSIRPKLASDAEFIAKELHKHWHSLAIWSLGNVFDASSIPAMVACEGGIPTGLLTYFLHEGRTQMEVVTLSTTTHARGVGTLLLESAANIARGLQCMRIFLTTTNDNLNAIGFYQRRGWKLARYHHGSMDRARIMKPEIPLIGENNIPLHDELEYELVLRPLSPQPVERGGL